MRSDSGSLPFSTACPLCQAGRLTLHHDSLSPVPVFSCAKCKRTGDLLDLVGLVRGKDRQGVLASLRESDVVLPEFENSVTSKDAVRIHRQRQALLMLDTESKQGARLLAHVGGMTMLDRMRVRRDSGMSWSDGGLPQLLGVIERNVADAIMCGRTDMDAVRGTGRAPRRIRLEHDNLLTLPFYDAPGHVSSVMLIGAKSNGKFESELIKMKVPPEWSAPLGTAQHPDTPGGTGLPLVLTTDVELFIHMHAKSFALDRDPLPLVCFHEQESHAVTWQHFEGRKLVILATEVTPRILWKAIRHDATICFSGPVVRTPYEYMREREPMDMIHRYRSEAVPWQNALMRIARAKSDDGLCQWLSAMELSSEEQQMLIEVAPIELAGAIEKALIRDVRYKSVPTLNGYVTQRQDGWYHVKPNRGEQLITDYPFRVVSATTNGKTTSYLIEVPCAAGNVRFTCDKVEFDAAPFTIVQREVISSGYGVPTFDASWQTRAVNLAMQFHRPVANSVPRMSGYDQARKVFASASAVLHVSTGEHKVFDPPLANMRGEGVGPTGRMSRDVRKFFTGKDHRDQAAATLALAGSWLRAISQGDAKLVCVTGPQRNEVVTRLSHELQLYPLKVSKLYGDTDNWAGHLLASDAELETSAHEILTRPLKVPVIVSCNPRFALHAALAGHMAVFTMWHRNPLMYRPPAVTGRALFRALTYASRYSHNFFRDPYQSCAAATRDLARADVYRMTMDSNYAREFDHRLVDPQDFSACAAVLIACHLDGQLAITTELKKHPTKGYLLAVDELAAFQAKVNAPMTITPAYGRDELPIQIKVIGSRQYIAVSHEQVSGYATIVRDAASAATRVAR